MNPDSGTVRRGLGLLTLAVLVGLGVAQDKSVAPGINDNFKKPDLTKYKGTFEGESREIYRCRQGILDACGVKEGDVIADVGAGTGLFTRMMAVKAGPKGKVFAVDISKEFLDHITQSAKDTNIGNIETVMATETSSNLKPDSVDLVFICDTYHHFEFPFKTMDGIHKALRKGGRLVVIDFERIEGKSKEWTLKHVRAGREVFQKEIEQAGFELKEAKKVEGLEENYFLYFVKKD